MIFVILVVVIVFIILAVNLITFLLYGIDKYKAKKNHWRISEKTLLLWGVFAPFGGILGMKIFRHKTQKAKFTIILAVGCILHILLYGTVLNMIVK